jgi:hypothetical protein
MKALWPKVPHQLCQFDYLREASKLMYELDRSTRTSMRKTMQRPVRDTRDQLAYQRPRGSRILACRAGARTGAPAGPSRLHSGDWNRPQPRTGRAPLEYPGIQAYDALADIDART